MSVRPTKCGSSKPLFLNFASALTNHNLVRRAFSGRAIAEIALLVRRLLAVCFSLEILAGIMKRDYLD